MKKTIIGQDHLQQNITKVMQIFINSDSKIRPHFVLTGPSGSGKSMTIEAMANRMDLNYLVINAAALTKEGTSGNSLSKALAPLGNMSGRQTICFVDEFDKLFISGNHNTDLAHETTNGVQNEFLKVLESDTASVFGDYGKYNNVPVEDVLFVFAGAFNGEEEITLDRLRDFGVKTEFLGRVGLVFNARALSLEDLLEILEGSPLLVDYLKLFPDVEREDVISAVGGYLKENYNKNPTGARAIHTLIHQYFINGGKLGSEGEGKKSTKIKGTMTLNGE